MSAHEYLITFLYFFLLNVYIVLSHLLVFFSSITYKILRNCLNFFKTSFLNHDMFLFKTKHNTFIYIYI